MINTQYYVKIDCNEAKKTCNFTIISMAELHTIDGRVEHFFLLAMYECIVSVCRHTSKYMCEWLIHDVRLYHLQILYAKKYSFSNKCCGYD